MLKLHFMKEKCYSARCKNTFFSLSIFNISQNNKFCLI